jgi:hypothetical protein
MIKTEGPNTGSFVKRAHSTKMNGTMILIMVPLLLMMLLLWQQNCRLSHGHNPTSHLSYPCTMGTRTQSNSWWAMRQQYPHTKATQLSWQSPSSWQSKTWPRHGILSFGQGQSRRGRSSRTCWLPVFKAFRRNQSQLRPCSSAYKTMRNTFRRMSKGSCDWEHKRPQCPMKLSLRPWSRVFDQDPRLNTSLGNLPKLWRSCFRRWMSTSELIMTFDKKGKKLTYFLRWLGDSEEESTLGMSDQSTAQVRMAIKEASFRGHSTPHSLRDSSKAPSGHQLQGAEAAGASEEDMGISPEKFIAYSVVRTKATIQEPVRSLFWSKKRLPKQKLGRISRSKSYILLRTTLPTYQNMWAIIQQLLLLRQVIHRLLALSSHRHHHYNLLILEASSQKGASTPNNNVNSERNPKLVQSTIQCQNQSTYTERYPASEILLCSRSFCFLIRNKQCKFSFNFL